MKKEIPAPIIIDWRRMKAVIIGLIIGLIILILSYIFIIPK
jgi:uncharacterized integral membrane protein